MKTPVGTKLRFISAVIPGMIVLIVTSARAATLNQTVDETPSTQSSSNWNSAVWGTPNAAPTAANNYVTTLGVRTLSTSSAAQTFAGNQLQIDPGGRLLLKHNNALATGNLVLNGGAISYNTGPGGSNSPIAGTLQVTADSTINSLAGTATRDIWLQSTMSGSGNLIVAMATLTNSLILSGNNISYSGNWTNTTGRLEIGNNTTNALGSGTVTLLNTASSLTFNSTNNSLVNNVITGAGSVTKASTCSVTLAANNTFTGGLTNAAGTLLLVGSGTQSYLQINSDSVLRVAQSAALPAGSTVRVNVNNAQTGRLELTNNVTLATGNPLQLRMRTTASVALESISGNNIVSDPISIVDGGSLLWIQADAGASLDLTDISAGVAGTRSVTLQGAGIGTVSGVIYDSASPVSVYKTGSGTWNLNNANSYSGTTAITNGVLKLGASGSIASSPSINLYSGGTLDATLVSGGLTLGSSQVLAGNGSVLGNVNTSAGNFIQPGFTNQYGPLSLGNNLTLGGGETIQFDLSTASNDVLNVTGSLTLNGSTTIAITLPTGSANVGTTRLINYTGTIQGGGSFTLVTPASSQTFALDTSVPGQVNLIVTGAPANLVWSGDGVGNVWDVGATANWNAQTSTYHDGDSVTFNDSGSATPDINVFQAVQPATMIVSNNTQAYIFDGSGISTSGSLVKRGSNVLKLANDGNNFSGPISIEAGTLSIGNGAATGSLGSGPITNNGALVVNHPGVAVLTISAPISGTGSIQMAGTLGDIGNNIMNLSASNSYSGPTTIETNSAISILNNNALGDTSTGTLVQAGGRVGFTALGTWTVAEPVQINGYGLSALPGALYANTVNNNVTWTGPITVGSPSQIRLVNTGVKMTLANTVIGNQTPLLCSQQDTGSILTFSNTLSLGNAAALTKDGSGTLLLAGNSNLCGGVIINAGTFQITTTNSPQLGNITVNGTTATTVLQLGSGLADGSMPPGAINLVGNGARLILNSSNTFTLNQELSGAGTVGGLSTDGALRVMNYGTLIINSSNSFTGYVSTGSGTPATGGTISLFNSYGLGDGTVPKNVTLVHASLKLQGGLDIPAAISFLTGSGNMPSDISAGVAQVIRNVSDNNLIEGPIIPTGGANTSEITVDSGTLTLNGTVSPNTTGRFIVLSGAGNGTLNGSLNNNGANIPALTKQGAGTWTLNNANDYSGATLIQGGTLVLGASATIANTPTLQLASNAVLNVSAVSGGFILGGGQTLGGNGTVIGDVAATGTVSPGASVGTLNFANSLTLSGATVLELNRTNAPNADLLSATTLIFGGTLTVTNIGADLQGGDTFNLFDGAISGQFAVTNLPDLSSTNLSWDVSLLHSQGILKVASTVAPTPTIGQTTLNGTNVVLQVSSQSGFNYVLEASSQLAPGNWTGIQTNAGGGVLTFTVPVTTANPQRFFRIRVE